MNTNSSALEQKRQVSVQEKGVNNPENIEMVMNLISQLPLNEAGNKDLSALAWGVYDGSLTATPKEIYFALLRSSDKGDNAVFTNVSNITSGVSLTSTNNPKLHEQRAERLNSLFQRITYTKDSKLELVKKNNVEDKEAKEQNEGEALFNDFFDFATTNYNDIVKDYTYRMKNDPSRKGDYIPNYFYKHFYSSTNNNIPPTEAKQEQYEQYITKVKQINPLIKDFENGWTGINQGNINKYPEKFIGRIYFNVDPLYGPKLLNQIHGLLNNKVNTYQAKIPSDYDDRKDNGVLYFTLKDQDVILNLIQQISSSNQFIFRDELGKGQKKLLKGIGFAQDATEGPTDDFRYYSDEDSNVTSFGGKLSYIFGKIFTDVEIEKLDWTKDKEQIKDMYEKLCIEHNVDPKDPAFHVKDNNFETIRNFAEQNSVKPAK